jgi:hypothetical protein
VIQVAPGASYAFGFDNEGLAGFTQSAGSATQIWTEQANSVQYRNQDAGTQNSSFLRAFTLDRSVGSSYTIAGTVALTDGYADDNNRVGLYLFGDFAQVPNEDEAGAIGLIFNMDDGSAGGSPGNDAQDNLNVRVGIDNTLLSGLVYPADTGAAAVLRDQTTTPYSQDLFGTTITFSADIDFINDGTNDLIEITASLIAAGDVTTSSTTVLASDYTGDYFGFVTRARARNYVEGGPNSAEGRSLPWVMDYQSFSIIPDPIPEPSAAGLVAAMAGAFLFIRRRSGS